MIDRPRLAFAVTLALLAAAPVARADDAAKRAAAERFDRGLKLFDEGNLGGALAELERAHALLPHVTVLFNIGLVQAAMGRPVEAVATLDKVLAQPGSLSPAKLEQARKTRDEQDARIGEVVIGVSVAGAILEVDGIAIGTAPLDRPLRVKSGEHVVAAVATGHAPMRKTVSVAGRARTEVRLDLVPMQGRLGFVTVRANVLAAEVRLDGELIGKAPLPGAVSVSPGSHVVEVRRPGYRSTQREVRVSEGAVAELALDLEEDPTSPHGRVTLTMSERDANVTVDGVPRGAATTLDLPVGPHRLKVERAGFISYEREVDVPAGASDIRIGFEPTPETRATFVSHASAARRWGTALTVTGGVAFVGGGGFLLYNAGRKSDRRDDLLKALDAENVCRTTKGSCPDEAAASAGAQVSYDNARKKDVFGWIGVGVGAAALGTGIYLLASGDDPHKYDAPPIALVPVLGPRTSGFVLEGRF